MLLQTDEKIQEKERLYSQFLSTDTYICCIPLQNRKTPLLEENEHDKCCSSRATHIRKHLGNHKFCMFFSNSV